MNRPFLIIEDVTKRFGQFTRTGPHLAQGESRRICLLPRTLGLREDNASQGDCRTGSPGRRPYRDDGRDVVAGAARRAAISASSSSPMRFFPNLTVEPMSATGSSTAVGRGARSGSA